MVPQHRLLVVGIPAKWGWLFTSDTRSKLQLLELQTLKRSPKWQWDTTDGKASVTPSVFLWLPHHNSTSWQSRQNGASLRTSRSWRFFFNLASSSVSSFLPDLSVLFSYCLFSQLDHPHFPYNITDENHEYTENPSDKITAHLGTTQNPENWPIQLNSLRYEEFQPYLLWGTELGYIHRGSCLQTRYLSYEQSWCFASLCNRSFWIIKSLSSVRNWLHLFMWIYPSTYITTPTLRI